MTDTGAPQYLPYMVDGDPMSLVASRMQELAERVERQLGQSGHVDITVTGSSSGSQAVVFPIAFTAVPNIQVTSSQTFLLAAMENPTTTGFTAYVRHINATTITGPSVFRVYWHAIPSD
jgi:hypothetical protein